MFEQIAHPQKRAFLAAFAECGRVKQAAQAANISREAHYDWKAQDPDYAAAFSAAQKLAGDALEDEAMRRAKLGVLEPVYQGGVRVGFKRKYSDGLLKMLLQGAKPEKYNTKTVEHKGEVKHQHTVDWEAFSDEDLKILEQLADKSRSLRPRSDPGGNRPAQGEETGPDVPPDGPAET